MSDIKASTRHILMKGGGYYSKATIGAQGRIDWESMLSNRAVDLAVDGKLALFNFGIDEEDRYLGSTGGIDMFDTFNEIWSGFRDDGVITSEEYLNTNFPQSYRTVEQFIASFRIPPIQSIRRD